MYKTSITLAITRGLRHGTQFYAPVREEFVPVCVEMRGDAGQVK